ncbi:hybrid sensor histidine kinase/response regulator [Leptolyngbya sp. 'hensonii']|uniref:hybrid sensor histidine kinase/response regulator n=1 Tax=Leptolyngbya sp. 'hensonii' TaxID=1922337 RepID=UPI00094F88F9|nr:response regulator [Leptolyngbya sp. 'hensonii']OLP16570.1 hybrid sensor histidine kinase/response regulator [Leptolyngbya sp. 'hensonii']
MTKILVIEDEPIIRESIVEILELDGYDVIAAENGRVGLQVAKTQMPDLVLCDIEMPELNGYQFLSTLRQDWDTATIPVIFLTAKVSRSDIRQGMTLGAEDYLTKPFTVDELRQAVTSQLQKKTIRQKETQTKLDELRGSIARSLPHELNTPLNGIIGITELLISQHGSINEGEGLELLQILHTSAARLLRLTKNFLLFAQLELIMTDRQRLAELRTNRAESYIPSIVEEVARSKAAHYHREADLELDLERATVLLAGKDLQKIAEELIDNAFKFSTAGTPVQLTGKQLDGAYHLVVSDQGQGMTTEQIDNIGAYMQFERRLYEQQGCGLGLAIVKRMLEVQDGGFTVDSLPGKGTSVQIILKLALT